MRRAIVHRTKGLLDLRAVTVMGLSAKPGTKNPIGMFGTGLKYALATICRTGGSPVVWIGRERHTFYSKAAEFRGQEFQQLRMKREGGSLKSARHIALPFTTEYGKFWQVWMAFRELESNTRDESGETFLVEGDELDALTGRDGETLVVVEHAEYVAAWTFRAETFLPNGARAPSDDAPGIEGFDEGPRDKLYWRGLRVKDLIGKKTVRTWNFLDPMQLTEDRTLASEWTARYNLSIFLARDCTDAKLIEAVITADDKHWEHRLDWPSHIEPSALFQTVSVGARGRAYGVGKYVGGYATPRSRVRKLDPWDAHPRPWKLTKDDDDIPSIVDANDTPVIVSPESFDLDDWETLMRRMLLAVNGGPSAAPTPTEDDAIAFHAASPLEEHPAPSSDPADSDFELPL